MALIAIIGLLLFALAARRIDEQVVVQGIGTLLVILFSDVGRARHHIAATCRFVGVVGVVGVEVASGTKVEAAVVARQIADEQPVGCTHHHIAVAVRAIPRAAVVIVRPTIPGVLTVAAGQPVDVTRRRTMAATIPVAAIAIACLRDAIGRAAGDIAVDAAAITRRVIRTTATVAALLSCRRRTLRLHSRLRCLTLLLLTRRRSARLIPGALLFLGLARHIAHHATGARRSHCAQRHRATGRRQDECR